MTPTDRKRNPLRAKLLLALGASSVALVVADLLFRWLEPRPYAVPALTDSAGRTTTIYEIIQLIRSEPPGEGRGPRGPGPTTNRGTLFRITYDRPEWDYFDETGSVTAECNSLGFRDREFTVAKQPGEYRILAIGDSFTFGIGVRLEDSWPQQLERKLAAGRDIPVEVINGGFAGQAGSPTGYEPWVLSDGIRFHPDVVILGFCLNDMHYRIPLLGYQIAKPEPMLGGISALLNHLQRKLAQRHLKKQPIDATAILKVHGDQHWKDCQAAIRKMHDALTKQGVRFLVVIQPMITRLGDDYPYLGLHEMVREFCANSRIECLDLLSRFRGLDAEDLWVHATDQHPNHRGHRIIAEGILDYLSRR